MAQTYTWSTPSQVCKLPHCFSPIVARVLPFSWLNQLVLQRCWRMMQVSGALQKIELWSWEQQMEQLCFLKCRFARHWCFTILQVAWCGSCVGGGSSAVRKLLCGVWNGYYERQLHASILAVTPNGMRSKVRRNDGYYRSTNRCSGRRQ